jgi:aminodeoxyfutalosine deaminase
VIRYHASWVLPIGEPPIRDGWISVEGGRVAAVGRRLDRNVELGARDVDLGSVVILPGLVNAHTHLELSYLRGRVSPARAFVDWIREVMAARRQRPDPNAPEIMDGVQRAIAEALAFGTAVIGDISNTLVTVAPLDGSPLAAVVFYELIAFNPDDAAALVDAAYGRIGSHTASDRVRISLAAHAPYSVAPSIFRAIQRVLEGRDELPRSIHLSESAEEVEFIRSGSGPWRTLLDEVGSWNPAWKIPAVSPVQYLDGEAFLDGRLLAVHGVQMTRDDLNRLRTRGTTLVACPRSNRDTGAGAPPIAEFYASGVRVAVGTDSLASTPDLNLFAELAEMRALAPAVPAAALLESATRNGAEALGFESDYGTIAPGKLARLMAIDVPGHVVDVEEYLVSGIGKDQIRWIEG